ncbi:hypothetical protein [Desulfoglaeba alkanexedens]|uniref:Uncharacterized protein n=1 Tax=Desulfoglaeba alkanexedens ALDC TaxID=980445 RepID=A0A4P8L2P1_9BACT|nr:hypothetical protein [Desulfoglaeba alkanexedens]QCQ21913.1 hypothetical protein FDQ92_06820 [Desulfoglaeba alkanexedens ALDC]
MNAIGSLKTTVQSQRRQVIDPSEIEFYDVYHLPIVKTYADRMDADLLLLVPKLQVGNTTVQKLQLR